MQFNMNYSLPTEHSDAGNWLPKFPNPADFRFDYFKLLANAPTGLATLPDDAPRSVAIVGAGSAGMTAARELLRCGFTVTVFEATERIGGRLYTAANPTDDTHTGMELGAMRMPFFPTPGSENCILEYYLLHEAGAIGHAASYAQFPNPGTALGGTGIYLNRGLGPNAKLAEPTMIEWPYDGKPDNATLQNLAAKAASFINFFANSVKNIYVADSDEWTTLWAKSVSFYDAMTFDDLVMMPTVEGPDPETGSFGGFGMTAEEASLLYTIGTGDGSWGAFYSIGALWFIRCTMFGFGGAQLQTVTGLSSPGSLPSVGAVPVDSGGTPMPTPAYAGIQSLVEYLYYVPGPGMATSLHDSANARLFIQAPVTNLERQADGTITVSVNDAAPETFDHVFVTSSQWATQMSFQFDGFSQEQLPQAKLTAEHTQHNISSCKLFFPLTEKYWEADGNKIPQVIVTDTYIQDAYSLTWDVHGTGTGAVILASYTWEDDSLKLLPYDEEELVVLVAEKLREITVETVGQDITDYFVTDQPVTIQWISEPGYNGCAKLYRQSNEAANAMDLSYNQNFACASSLYFAGENYSSEGGWTEPALRSALDGVLQLLNNVGATFTVADFDFATDYPRW